MDWGPYDLTTLHFVLQPLAAEVLTATSASPITGIDPTNTTNDVEQFIKATIRYTLADDQVLDVAYERAACIHGEPRLIAEIEGTRGAVAWNWLTYQKDPRSVILGLDHEGQRQTQTTDIGAAPLSVAQAPLVMFQRAVREEHTATPVDVDVVFNFCVLLAIYDVIQSGMSERMAKGDLR